MLRESEREREKGGVEMCVKRESERVREREREREKGERSVLRGKGQRL